MTVFQLFQKKKEGIDVAWESTGTFKGYSFTSTWTVTNYIQDRLVTMEDLKDKIGSTTLQTEPLSGNKTKYSMQISTKMYTPFNDDFFDIYRNEMKLIKKEAERIYKAV